MTEPSNLRPSRAGHRWWSILALLLVLWLPRAARAEAWGQYLVVIDDSGSMDGSDPERRVLLASLALVEALGDSDQVMLVGLNELAGGAPSSFVSPRELLRERDGAEGERALANPRFDALARHRGQTPCKQALAQAKTILEAAAGSGAPQTLLLLTDGACTDPVEPADTWLSGLTSHAEGRFRFVLLSNPGPDAIDAELVRYAAATGWTGQARIGFDVRSLLRAFADVLSFSRGLRFDDGGVHGLSRSFAGAREVRVLAISEAGKAPINLEYTDDGMDSRSELLAGGPTFHSSDYGWSLRAAKTDAHSLRMSVHSTDAGVEVLVIPSYGELRVEATVAPCGEFDGEAGRPASPPVPWTRERAVRSGQPACAWARLVGDTGNTIHPQDSFPFTLALCEDQACSGSSAMQPGTDGSFNAQLGVFAKGRHERWFRASGGSLARPITTARGFQSMAFGIADVRKPGADQPLDTLALGLLPQPGPATRVALEIAGSFPAGAEAELACELAEGSSACFSCSVLPTRVAMQDPFRIELEAEASAICPALHETDGVANVSATLWLRPKPDAEGKPSEIPAWRLPITAELRYAVIEPQRVSAIAGESTEVRVTIPAPVGGDGVALDFTIEASGELPEGLVIEPIVAQQTFSGHAGETAELGLRVSSPDCCDAGDYSLVLVARAGDEAMRVPLTVTIEKPSFWTCPGKQIVIGLAGLAALGLLIWLVRGFTSPAKFADGAVLVRAESHEALAKVVDGDEDWRLVRSLEPTKRGFYKPATVHFGGSQAALPSLRGLSDDAKIEARPNGNATLVVSAEGIEQFKESTGWQLVPVGQHPLGSSIVLRRDDTYVQFRR
ncbi:hypothetical protein ACNOYE_32735 [Nannocystaceae bacterium ST9]